MRNGRQVGILTLALLTGVGAAASAAAQEPIDRAMNAKIRTEGLEHSRAYAMLDTITTVFGPRLTGSPAFLAAVHWARGELASFGLSSARIETFPFAHGWELQQLTLDMVEPRFMPLIGYPEAWTVSTPGEIVGTPIYLPDKSADELTKMAGQLKGAILLPVPLVTHFIDQDRVQPTDPAAPSVVVTGAPRAPSIGETQAITRVVNASGAGVVLRPSTGIDGTVFVQGGRYNGTATVPSIIVAAEHYNMIVRMLADGVPVKLRVNEQSRFLEQDKNGYNVIAEIPGTDPALRDEVVMAGAHLDSWHTGTGASDNADGVATLLEAMRILQAVGAKPRRTIRVAIWGGEEEGLLGSAAWVASHIAGFSNTAARQNLSVYMNLDPGTGSVYGFYMEGNSAAKAIFDAWLEPFKDLGMRKNVIEKIGNTDHLSFINAGVPGFNAIQDYDEYDVRMHHTNMDTIERVPEAGLKESAIVFASFLYHAAMRDEKIPR
jgi:carboxypeptidase Q